METLLIALECLKAGRHLYSPVITPQEIAPLLLMIARIMTWYHKLTPQEPSHADIVLFFFSPPPLEGGGGGGRNIHQESWFGVFSV